MTRRSSRQQRRTASQRKPQTPYQVKLELDALETRFLPGETLGANLLAWAGAGSVQGMPSSPAAPWPRRAARRRPNRHLARSARPPRSRATPL